jgi:hypothetical protein
MRRLVAERSDAVEPLGQLRSVEGDKAVGGAPSARDSRPRLGDRGADVLEKTRLGPREEREAQVARRRPPAAVHTLTGPQRAAGALGACERRWRVDCGVARLANNLSDASELDWRGREDASAGADTRE